FARACDDLGLDAPALPDSDSRFNIWLRTRLGLQSRTQSWPWMIWVVSPDEEAAFESYFRLWKEFTADGCECPHSAPPGKHRASQPQLLRLLLEEKAWSQK